MKLIEWCLAVAVLSLVLVSNALLMHASTLTPEIDVNHREPNIFAIRYPAVGQLNAISTSVSRR